MKPVQEKHFNHPFSLWNYGKLPLANAAGLIDHV
jgi:hypothetical protein